MPIYRLLKGKAFDPEHCRAMGEAFDETLKALGLSDRDDPACELVVLKIIEPGESGERDPARLLGLAVKAFKVPPLT